MTVVWLSRYLSAVLAMLAVLTSAMTFHPDVQWLGTLLTVSSAIGAVIGLGLSWYLGCLPAAHWVHRAMPVRVGLAIAVAVSTLLLLAIG